METVLDGARAGESSFTERYSLEIQGLRWEAGEFGIRYITGRVTGRTHANLDWAKIEFKLYDQFDAHVGSASDHLRGFSSGCIWNFKAPVIHKGALCALLADVTCEYGSIYHPTTASFAAGVVWCPPEPSQVLKTMAELVKDASPQFA
jgi:hypothetical protein